MIIFNDAQTLSVSRKFDYLGENNFNYRKVNSFSVKGRFLSNNASDGASGSYFGVAYVEDTGIWYPLGDTSPLVTGVPASYSGYLSFDENGNAIISLQDPPGFDALLGSTPSPLYDIWSEMDNIRDKMKDFQEIVLNGVSLGSGRVLSFNFPSNIDARKSEFEVEFETYHSGDLSNWSGENYGGTIGADAARFVSSLSESFDFEFLKDGTLNYSRSLDFDMISRGSDYTVDVQRAKSFASGIFFNDPAFSSLVGQYPGFYQQSGARIFTEKYNAINGSYAFSETFKGPTSGQGYYWTNSFSFSVGGEGDTTISEDGKIQAVRYPLYENALSGLDAITATSKARAEDFYFSYSSGCADQLFLSTSSKNIDRYAGTIDYSFEYLNDPLSTGCFTITRSIDCQTDENGSITVTEEGSVADKCGSSGQERLENSINHFNTSISGGVFNRVFDYYSSKTSGCGCSGAPASGDLRLLTREKGYSEYNGLFNYSFAYRNDCSSLVDNCYIVSIERETDDTVHNVFLGVTVNSGEMAQKQNTSSLLRETQNISILGQCTGLDIESYLALAVANVSRPSGNTFYMDTAQYSFDPDNSRFDLSVYYNYTGYRAYPNINV